MKIILLAAFVAVVASQSYPEPAYKTESYPPQPYSFDWNVLDAPSYNNYGHSEKSDGNVVTGSYRVALPDGRTQIVTYKADSYGYNADVKYEGVAKYPEYKPASYAAPSAAPPAYKAPSPPPAAPVAPYAAPAPAPPAYIPPTPTAAPAYKLPQIVPLAYRG